MHVTNDAQSTFDGRDRGRRKLLCLGVGLGVQRAQGCDGAHVGAVAQDIDGFDALLFCGGRSGEQNGCARLLENARDGGNSFRLQRLFQHGQSGFIARAEDCIRRLPSSFRLGRHQGERANGVRKNAAKPVVDSHGAEWGGRRGDRLAR